MSRLTRITDSNTTAYVVQEYSGDYATISKEIQDPRMAQWSKTTLDNAYFCLLYADRTGAFTQVYSMLGMIEIAQKGGLNIDDNSFGIAQADRDAIKARADASSQRTHE